MFENSLNIYLNFFGKNGFLYESASECHTILKSYIHGHITVYKIDICNCFTKY